MGIQNVGIGIMTCETWKINYTHLGEKAVCLFLENI